MVFAYGILGGLGVGFAYVTPIATCIKWFPDMRGTITGLAVFGFGAGTLVFGPLINKLIVSSGLANTFYAVGVIMLVCVCGAGSMFKVPPAGYKPAGWNPPTPSSTTPTKADWTPNEIIGNGQFYVLWLIYFFGAAAGLMIIGQAVPIGIEVAKLDKTVAAAGLGTMALLNGLGRLVHGSISDKIGRKNTVILCFAEYLVAFLLLLPNADTFTKWLVGLCIVGFSYGGYLAIMPSITADYFGTKSLGANYGYLFTAWGVAGVVRPVHDRRDQDVHRRLHDGDVLHLRRLRGGDRAGLHLQEAGVQGSLIRFAASPLRRASPSSRLRLRMTATETAPFEGPFPFPLLIWRS